MIALRLRDPLTPRSFKIPGNFKIKYRGEDCEIPIIGIIGFVGIFMILIFVLITHHIGRIAGPSWLVLGFIIYVIYRKRKGLPVFGSQKRDWATDQIKILRDAGELELMDELIQKLKERGRTPGTPP